MLKSDEKIKVIELRNKGYGYKAIAGILKIKRDAVRDYCKSKGLEGYLGYGALGTIKENNYSMKCNQCGKEINRHDTAGRKQKFCSEECRRLWWNEHPEKKKKRVTAWYTFTCKNCGKEFKAYGNKNRKFCSVGCASEYRFGSTTQDEEVLFY